MRLISTTSKLQILCTKKLLRNVQYVIVKRGQNESSRSVVEPCFRILERYAWDEATAECDALDCMQDAFRLLVQIELA